MKITNAEIVAVAERSADVLTERRVLAAALNDPGLQRRLLLLQTVDAESEQEAPLPELDAALLGRLARLQEGMEIAARRVGREFVEQQTETSETLATSETSADRWASLVGRAQRVFTLEKRPIRLSALAPALAASEDNLQVQRESFDVEGIHIEIHQLPDTPPRLRFLVDASRSEGFRADATNAAVLALQEAGIVEFWLVTVPLNAQGIGAWEQPAPAVRGAVELLGVALVDG
jgi:hypothetical protein